MSGRPLSRFKKFRRSRGSHSARYSEYQETIACLFWGISRRTSPGLKRPFRGADEVAPGNHQNPGVARVTANRREVARTDSLRRETSVYIMPESGFPRSGHMGQDSTRNGHSAAMDSPAGTTRKFDDNARSGRCNSKHHPASSARLEHFPIIPDQFAPRRNLPAVIAGLDPAIHLSGEISRVSGPPDQVRG
jgi:hypothetical protein